MGKSFLPQPIKLSDSGPPPNANFYPDGKHQSLQGHGSPQNLVLGYTGDDYLDLDTGDTWNKMGPTDEPRRASMDEWEPEGDSLSTIFLAGTTTPRSNSERWSGTVDLLDFGASTASAFDNTPNIRAAAEYAQLQCKVLDIPDGVFRCVPDALDYIITCDAVPADGFLFNDFCIKGNHTGVRPSKVALTPHQIHIRGSVLLIDGDMSGKVAIQTGMSVANFVMENVTVVGHGFQEETSTGILHNVSSTKLYLDNCSFQHWGTAIDLGGDYVENGDTHADYNVLNRVFVFFSGIGVKVSNFQGCVNEFYSCEIQARICYWNAKSAAGITQSAAVNIFGGFVAPHPANGMVVFEAVVVSASGQDIVYNPTGITKTTKVWNWDTFSVTDATGVAATESEFETGMFVIVERNCNATGSTRVPAWGVTNIVTGVNTGTNTITVTGLVDLTEIVGEKIFLSRDQAIGFYGGNFNVIGTRVEISATEGENIGPVIAYLHDWECANSFKKLHVKLYQSGRFHAALPKFIHIPVYAVHGSPLIIEKGQFEMSYPNMQVSGSFGVKLKDNVWIVLPKVNGQDGKMAEGVVRINESHLSKVHGLPFSAADFRSRILQMGADRYEQRGGLFYRPIVHQSSAPTTGVTNELHVVVNANNQTQFFTIGADLTSGLEGYFGTAVPAGTAVIDINDDPGMVTMSSFLNLDPQQIIDIAGAGAAGATHRCKILHMDSNSGATVRTMWITPPAITSVGPTAAVTAVAPPINSRVKFGTPTATDAVAEFLGGKDLSPLTRHRRTDGLGTPRSWVTLVGDGTLIIGDETVDSPSIRHNLKLTSTSSVIAGILSGGLGIAGDSGPTWTSGTGVPATSHPNGSIFSRTDGTGPNLYVRENGAWVAK